MRRDLVAAVLLLSLLLTSCGTVELDDGTRDRGLVAEIPFRLHGSTIVAEFAVDDSVPLSFIFDTAAGGTIISAKVAAELEIVGDETVSREGGTGTAQIALSADHALSSGDLRLSNVTLGIAELDHIDRRMGMRVDGVVGWAILSRYAVRVDYDAEQIEVYDTRRFDYALGGTRCDVDVQGTSFFATVTAVLRSGESFTGQVLVDTGAGTAISFNTPFAEENDLLRKAGAFYERELQSLSTESARVYMTSLANLSIGDAEFAAVPARIAFAETGALSWPGVMGILGNAVLKRFNLFVDLRHKRMFLEPNHLYTEPFQSDCSGLELVMDDTLQKVIVDHVYAGSPAEQAGLKVGDEVVRIDGVSVQDLSLPECRTMLSQDGQDVEIAVNREGQLRDFLVWLRLAIE